MVLEATPERRRSGGWRRGQRVPALALFAIVALALLGTFALIFATVEAERVQRREAARTSAVIVSLNQIVRAALNGETAQRGYFITNDRRYLEPYGFGQQLYRTEMARLRERIEPEGNERQIELLDEIERMSDAKWAELAATIDMVREGRIIEAHNRILSDEGQLAMAGLRSAVARLEQMERVSLEQATARAAESEGRIVPGLIALFVIIVCALALGLWQSVRTARAEAAAANAMAIAEARDRADLLAKELNHRVKNLFAVILAIVKMSARNDPAAAPAVERIAKRIQALITAHEVTQGAPGDTHVDLADLIAKVIAPYRSSTEKCELTGGSLVLAGKHAVPLGLVLHELVTNAVKYGAWSAPGGLLKVHWRADSGRVKLDWEEICAPAVAAANPALAEPQDGKPAREGFGTMLIRSSARQLDGRIERRAGPSGIIVEMDFPLVT